MGISPEVACEQPFASGMPGSIIVIPANDEKAWRKAHPVYSGFIKYFPDAIEAVAHVSHLGNEQHHPGEPLHWDRHKSTDQMDSCQRHIGDDAKGIRFDSDGGRHLAKAAWRILAELQIQIETENAKRKP
jgi:hypothetical protein